jgi:signal transduction histidine kinase/ligand-binding sensor domain-containing protein
LPAWSIALIFFGQACYALDPSSQWSQYIREYWNADSGFPGGRVHSIAQSADGYLWIGTEEGLLRFDGKTFTILKDPSPNPLALDRVLGLKSDSQGGLWIRLPGPSIVRFRDGAFTAVRLNKLHDPQVTATAQGLGRSILLASQLDGLLSWTGTRLEQLIARTSLPVSPITSITRSENNDIWLGTTDVGLVRVRGNIVTPIKIGLPAVKINCLLAKGDDSLYVGTDGGLIRWDGSRLTRDGVPNSLRTMAILAMTTDRDGNTWIGTNKGLFRLGSQGISSFEQADSEKTVTALFEDREGDLWAGTSDGLERIKENAFTRYQYRDHVDHEYGGPVHADSLGRIWTAPVTGGLYYIGDQEIENFPLIGLDGDEVYSMAGDGDGLWVGRKQGGLTYLPLRGRMRSLLNYTHADGLPLGSIYAVHQNRDKSVWVGTMNGGVGHFDHGRWTTYTTVNGLGSNTVFSISEGGDGTMWFSTPSGLTSLKNSQWRTYGVRDKLPSENVYTLFEDGDGVLWIGTLHGLAFIHSGELITPAGLPPALTMPILGITQDQVRSIWISTEGSVFRLDRAKLLSGLVSQEDWREFGVADGWHGAKGIRRERSIETDSSGRVWFSRTNGLWVINPTRFRKTVASTIVHVDLLSADGVTQDLRSPVPLPSDLKRIVIQYKGLNLSAPDHIHYRFKLDGFDRSWTDVGAIEEAAYTNLGPGTYRFHVMASNADQSWNGVDAQLSFSVNPAVWQTSWFWISCLITFLLVIVLVYNLRMHQITEQVKMQFEARLAERNRIARDLHDTLLQSFHGLMMRFQAVDNMLPEKPLQAKRSLDIAIDLATQAITDGRDAVQELRATEASNSLVEILTSLGQEFTLLNGETNAASYRVLLEGTPRQLHPRLQDDLYRISREAVANAFQHASATRIELDLQYGARILRLRVRDDGIGMDPAILAKGRREGHWGLQGMQERAKTIRGRLEIWSELSRGTEIELTVPANVAYMKSGHNA